MLKRKDYRRKGLKEKIKRREAGGIKKENKTERGEVTLLKG